MILHLTCLNVILNILPSCGNINFALVVFAVGPLLQLALVTTSPSLPVEIASAISGGYNVPLVAITDRFRKITHGKWK